MGFIRTSIVLILSFLMFFSFILMNLFLVGEKSLNYDTIKPALKQTVQDYVQQQIDLNTTINEKTQLIQQYCANYSEYVFNQEGFTFVIPCSIVNDNKTSLSDYLSDYLIENISNEIYYKQYDCSFLNCFREMDQPFFIISKQSYDYFSSKFYLFLIISIISFLLIFLFSETKSNSFVISGVLLGISALPFAKLNYIISFLPDKYFLNYLGFIFEKSYSVFLMMFIIGIILLIFGILLKFFSLGIKLSNLINKLNFKTKKKVKKENSKINESIQKNKKSKESNKD